MKDTTLPLGGHKEKSFLHSAKHREIPYKKWFGWAGGYTALKKKKK